MWGGEMLAIEEVFNSIGVKAEIGEVRQIGGGLKGGREMIIVRLKDEELSKKGDLG